MSYGISEVMADYERIEERTRMINIVERARREMMDALQATFVGRPITPRTVNEITAFLMPYQAKLQMLLDDESVRVDVMSSPDDPYAVYVNVSRDPSAFARTPPRYRIIFVERPFIV